MPLREDPPLHIAELRLAPEPSSAGVARRFLRARLDQWDVTDGREDQIVLLTSELVSNGVCHAHSAMTLTVTLRRPGHLRVELRDDSPKPLVLAPARPDAEQGRGLGMVDALATDWGVKTLPTTGKVVWFEFAAARARSVAN